MTDHPGQSMLADLEERGLVHQCTDRETAEAAIAAGSRVYIGFDPTASSLHVGSLQQILMLRRLQLAGAQPVALVGGGTGLIGDPSGKSSERQLLDAETVNAHATAVAAQLASLLDGSGPCKVILANNREWLSGLGVLSFLRDVGKHFSINAMVQRDSVRTRLETREQGITYTEFSYMLLQAYDFYVLYRDWGCRGQLGGSDQWGNIVSGVDLIRRLCGDTALAEAPFGFTSPLLTTRSGAKFGKTETGTVWLDPARTSPYMFYQFWLQAEDDDLPALLRRFTLMPLDEIRAIEARHAQDPAARAGQQALASATTRYVHGEVGLRAAERATKVLFVGAPGDADPAELASILADVPSVTIDGGAWREEGRPLRTLLVGPGRAFASSGEAKRKVREGAVRVNGLKLDSELHEAVDEDVVLHQGLAIVRVGRKATWLVRIGEPATEGP